jgi:hypothetical protein
MHFEQAQKDILGWISGFVEAPNTQLNGWSPCPYARRARLNGELEIRPGIIDPYTDLQPVTMGNKTVIAYVYDPSQFAVQEFEHQIQSVNMGFLIPRNMIALADHPDRKEEIRGVVMNQGTWAIAFVQPLDELNRFARLIADKGYYEGWSEDYLKELFEFRQDPRS